LKSNTYYGFIQKKFILGSLLVASHTHSTNLQVLGILYGEGSAGKSVLMALLRLLLGRFYKDMNKDIIMSAQGQRAAAKGASSPLEAGEELIPQRCWK
jgi:hypothetical protein